MSEFNQTRSSPALPLLSSVNKQLTKQRQICTIEHSGQLQKVTSSTGHVQQHQSHLRYRRSMQQMQYRLLVLIYLLLGLSTISLSLGLFNWFTLHSLQEKVQQRL